MTRNKFNYVAVPKQIYIIAGPNGAGKTTFAKSFIPATPHIQHFVNADLIAAGLAPFAPESEALQAGKLMLRQMEKLVQRNVSFCMETTLSGRVYATKIPLWQARGYEVILIFLRLDCEDTAIHRVAVRVRQGGHHIPENDIRRRFAKGLANFEQIYKNLVDNWMLYDNCGQSPLLINRKYS